ncbi:hypothetical protein LR48_Vigan01g104400 [Vigna angularis]|uniref:Uncharacterized protein n=1 Tax=Phaseolus angularis TaxID=3914 RepID=A0A0L9TMX2_PHAAN|nr:hypothetical protein LR48_Vigan01g104400 [Vigna angularis]
MEQLARRNLAGENFAGQIHRLETLQVLQLKSEQAGERIHLKKEHVHILKPSEVSRNIAGESTIRGVETDKLGQVSNLRRDAVGVSVVVANVELAKRGEVSKLREMFPMSLLGVARCHTWEGSGRRKSCCRGGDDGGGAWRRWRGGRDRSGHVVVVEIKDLEIGKAGEVLARRVRLEGKVALKALLERLRWRRADSAEKEAGIGPKNWLSARER